MSRRATDKATGRSGGAAAAESGPGGKAPLDGPPPPSLSVCDLLELVRAVDVGCEAGAYRGWAELERVTRVRGRVLAFVRAVAPELVDPPGRRRAPAEATPDPDGVRHPRRRRPRRGIVRPDGGPHEDAPMVPKTS